MKQTRLTLLLTVLLSMVGMTVMAADAVTKAYGRRANGGITIYVKCDTAPFIWSWGAADGVDYNVGPWPGTNQFTEKWTDTETGDVFWTWTFPDGVYPISFLFNNGGVGAEGQSIAVKQTADINSVSTDRYFILAWDDGNGNVSLVDITEEYIALPDAEVTKVSLAGNHNGWTGDPEWFNVIEAGKTFQITVDASAANFAEDNLWQFKFRPNGQDWVGYWDVYYDDENNPDPADGRAPKSSAPSWLSTSSEGNFQIDLEADEREVKGYALTVTWNGGKEAGKNWSFNVEKVTVTPPEPYAILTDNNTVLKFYYDNQKAVRNGMSVGPFTEASNVEWYAQRESIKTVEFDQSFANCTSITSTAHWFYGCSNLESINDLNVLNTENVTDMRNMFQNCSRLTSLDLRSFNTQNVTTMYYLFSGCSGLTSISVSNFNTQNVTSMTNMFYNCSGITSLDLSSFDTQKVTSMSSMFNGCSGLITVYVGSGWTTEAVTSGAKMFNQCRSIVGGAGTPYDSSHTDHAYAHIDGGESNPGYFTDKNAPASTFNGEVYMVEQNSTITPNQPITATQSVTMTPGNDYAWTADGNMGPSTKPQLVLDVSQYYGATGTYSFAHSMKGTNTPKDGELTTDESTGEVKNSGTYYRPRTKNLPHSGSYVVFETSQDGSLIIPIRVPATRAIYVTDGSGNALTDIQIRDDSGNAIALLSEPLCAISTTEEFNGFVSFNAKQGEKYYVFVNSAAATRYGGYAFSPEAVTINPATMANVLDLVEDPVITDMEIFHANAALTVEPGRAMTPTQSVSMTPGTDKEWTKRFLVDGETQLNFTASQYYPSSSTTYAFDYSIQGANNPKDGGLAEDGTNTGSSYDYTKQNLPQSGDFVIYEASKDGSLIIPFSLNANKPIYVVDANGKAMTDIQIKDASGQPMTLLADPLCVISTTDSSTGFLSFNVKQGERYYVFGLGTKARFSGYVFNDQAIDIDPATMANVKDILEGTTDTSTLEIYSIQKSVTYAANQSITPTQSIIMTPGNDSEWRTDLAIGLTNTATGESNDPLEFRASIYYPNSTETFSFLDALRGTLNPKDGDLSTNADTGEVTNTGSAYDPVQRNLPKSGAYIIYEALQNGSLIIPIRVTADKSLFVVTADGSLVLDMQFKDAAGTTQVFKVDPLCSVSSEYISGFISFNVEAGQKYYVFCNASKPRIAGYVFSTEPITIDPATMADVKAAIEVQPYAAFNNDNTVLKFYYDDKKASRNGMSVGPFSRYDESGWYAQRESIKTVEFDQSFANCTSITSTAYWFYGCSNLTSISGIDILNTENVTNMQYMFYKCESLTTLEVRSFNTTNVRNMYSMFFGCSSLTSLDVSNFNTQKVTDMSCMFLNCSSLTSLDVSHFETQNVTGMAEMFERCSSLTSLDVSNFNTQNVGPMQAMFEDCSGLTSLDVSHFNTQNVKYMHYMFSGCSGLTSLDLSNFDTQNVTNMYCMFYRCSNLTSLDVSNFNTQNVTSMHGMFWDCSSLTFLDVSNLNTQNVTSMYCMFAGCSGLTSLNVSNFNTQNVTDMGWMFSKCSGLTSLDVSKFDTQNVTDMSYMFYNCSGLTSLDLSNFDTQNVTDMSYMFLSCPNLATIYAGSGWTTEAVSNGADMFTDCTSLVGGAGTPYDANHTDYTYAHIDGGESNPGYFTDKNTPVVTIEPYAVLTDNNTVLRFYYDDQREAQGGMSIDYGNTVAWSNYAGEITTVVFDPSFANCTSITSTKDWFYRCSNLTTITNLKYLNTANVTNMNLMFGLCSSLTNLDVSSFNTSNVYIMAAMFQGCSSLKNLDLRNFDTSRTVSMDAMFESCVNLTTLDISSFNTSNVNGMVAMFSQCSSLPKLDVSKFNTSRVSDMSWMFAGCSSLTTLDVSSFDTSSARWIAGMFSGCSSFTSLNLSSFDTSNVTNMSNIFDGCSSLTSLFLGKAKIANIEFKRIKNPNLLVYVTDAAAAPATVTNVVINGVAERIVLTDATEGNNNFNCPQQFTAQSISYTHNYKQYTKPDICQGWETIALPFTVKEITHEKNGKITPFGVDGGKPFWLKQMTDHGMVNSDSIRANMPYLICMPSSKFYSEDYRLNGKVTFSAMDCVVPVTDLKPVSGGDKTLIPTFQRVNKQPGVYAVNVNEPYGEYPEGSIFVQDYRDVRPFEAYTEHAAGSREFFCIDDLLEETTGVSHVRGKMSDVRDDYYNLNGQRVEHPRKGLYIVNGRKVVIK